MRRFCVVLSTVLIAAAFGCSSDDGDGAPGPEGSYAATALTLSAGGGDTNLLAEGAELNMVLTSSGTTSGTLVVPAAYTESGTEESFSLIGTYTYNASTGDVTFDQAADTFVRDATWTLDGNELHGEFVSSGSTIEAVLTR